MQFWSLLQYCKLQDLLIFRPFSATRKCEIPGASRCFASWTPIRALLWTRWGPSFQLALAVTIGHCISCLRHDSPTTPTISHWPAQFFCTPPKSLITRPTDKPPIKSPPKNLLPAGVLLRGVTKWDILTCQLRVVSCQLIFVSCELISVSCQLRVASCQLIFVSSELISVSCKLRVVSWYLSAASWYLSVASCELISVRLRVASWSIVLLGVPSQSKVKGWYVFLSCKVFIIFKWRLIRYTILRNKRGRWFSPPPPPPFVWEPMT